MRRKQGTCCSFISVNLLYSLSVQIPDARTKYYAAFSLKHDMSTQSDITLFEGARALWITAGI